MKKKTGCSLAVAATALAFGASAVPANAAPADDGYHNAITVTNDTDNPVWLQDFSSDAGTQIQYAPSNTPLLHGILGGHESLTYKFNANGSYLGMKFDWGSSRDGTVFTTLVTETEGNVYSCNAAKGHECTASTPVSPGLANQWVFTFTK
ncbi:hypothetical protein ACIRS1_05255 [Kitasatospora sp. NPDC101176]|uniref:hypothetical protein n=1 Tax=Kitasatospora sp. NPDC101176 TaxID=3364099 RepID=UPI00380771B1